MLYASDYRRMAREALRGKWKKTSMMMFLATAVTGLFGLGIIQQVFFSAELIVEESTGASILIPYGIIGWGIWGAVILWSMLSSVIYVGRYRFCAAVLDGKSPSAQELFPAKLFWKAIAVSFLQSLLVLAGFMCFVIPGIIIALQFSMADYLLAANPEMGIMEVLRESRRRMYGHKMEFFGLQFSFVGWIFLQSFATMPLTYAIRMAGGVEAGSLAAVIASFALTYADWISLGFLDSYMYMTQTIFFRNIENPRQPEPSRPEFTWENFAGENAGEDTEENDVGVIYHHSVDNEPAAKALFHSYGCSRARLREAGELETYENYHIDTSAEQRWLRERGQELMLRFSYDSAALDNLLPLIGEYGMDELLDRVLERIDRHIRQNTLLASELLNMVGRCLALVKSGLFSDRAAYVQRKQDQLLDMAERIAGRLEQEEPDGSWQDALRMIRQM